MTEREQIQRQRELLQLSVNKMYKNRIQLDFDIREELAKIDRLESRLEGLPK
jgi:hypothetical protein